MKGLIQILVILLSMYNGQLLSQEVDQAALAKLQETRSFGWGISAINSWAHGVMKTDDGMVWLTSADGLVRFDGKRFIIVADPNRTYTYFRRVFKIGDKIYLGDMDKPLHFYNTSDSIPKIERVNWDQNKDGELNIWSTYKHHDDRFFLTDYKGIIYQYHTENQLDTFFVMPPDVVDNKLLKHTARYIRSDPFDRDMIWVCSIHGLFHVNMIDKSFEFYYPKDQYGLHIRLEEEGFTFYDHIQMGNNIWISSFENGLIRFNIKDKSFKPFRYELPYDETSIGTNNIRSHQQYDDQNIIIGGRDLKIFNTVDNKFYDFNRGHDDFDPPVLLAVEIYKDGEDFYTISAGALSKIAPEYNLFTSGKLSRLKIPDDIKSITDVKQLSNSLLEISTNTGQHITWDLLNLKLQLSDKVAPAHSPLKNNMTYTSNEIKYTLEDNKIYKKSAGEEGVELQTKGLTDLNAIHIDGNNDLWIKAKEGLVRYNIIEQEYRIYGQKDGLWNYVWSDAGIIQEFDDGSLFVSTGPTFAYFHPDKLLGEDYDLYPYVYKLEVFDQTKLFSRDLAEETSITLAPEDNYFSIHYSTKLTNQGQNIVYECKLDGFDEHWIDIGKSNMITYSKVPPGDYTFKLKAKYPGSKWSEINDKCKITIEPTFTQTNLFKFLIAGLVAGLILLFYRLRTGYLLKEQKIKSEFEQALSEAKLEALRSQMNPHFLFNSLNSIDNYILSNRPQEASEYLSKFAKLIRNILDFSKRKQITLSEEIITSKLYLDMEQMRFRDRFESQFESSESINLDKELIPPLILQPYIENAIWHGLLHKEGKGKLLISIEKEDQNLIITIDDNGIGRAKATAIKSKSATKHKSYGMKITEARIKIINDLNDLGGQVKILDKYDKEGIADGTKVILSIPSVILNS